MVSFMRARDVIFWSSYTPCHHSRKQNVKAFMHTLKLLLINAGIIFEGPLVLFTENYFTGICIMFEYALFSNQSDNK